MGKKILYRPETCVWELTTQCNLHCAHCASACSAPREDELGEQDMLALAEQAADMGLRWVSLTGGELLMTSYWASVAAYLEQRGVQVHMITNGTLVTPQIAEQISRIGVSMVSVSMDGTKEIHDGVRGAGMYEKSCNGLRLMGKEGIRTGCITSVMKENFPVLEEMKEELIALGVGCWQLQLAFPEGNMRRISGSVLKPEQVSELIELAAELAADQRIRVVLPDNVGYYTKRETCMRSSSKQEMAVWKGCNAGVRSFGILSNGAVVGCTSMRGRAFTEGKFPQNSLREIWDNPDAFAWRRKLQVSDLKGDCEKCRYAALCLGGCSNIRYTINGTVYSSNPYCAYHSVSFKETF